MEEIDVNGHKVKKHYKGQKRTARWECMKCGETEVFWVDFEDYECNGHRRE